MRMRRKLFAVGVVLTMIWFGSAVAQEEQPSESRAAEWKLYFDAGEVEQLARELYTEDAVWLNDERTIAEGRDAVLRTLEGFREAGLARIETQTQLFDTSTDWAYEFGAYAFQIEDGTTVAEGDYLLLMRREEGQWKVFLHMARPAPPAEAEAAD